MGERIIVERAIPERCTVCCETYLSFDEQFAGVCAACQEDYDMMYGTCDVCGEPIDYCLGGHYYEYEED